jgi:hypothetical protein
MSHDNKGLIQRVNELEERVKKLEKQHNHMLNWAIKSQAAMEHTVDALQCHHEEIWNKVDES